MVITGSSRSLGRHFALACAAQGASVVVNGTNESALADVDLILVMALKEYLFNILTNTEK